MHTATDIKKMERTFPSVIIIAVISTATSILTISVGPAAAFVVPPRHRPVNVDTRPSSQSARPPIRAEQDACCQGWVGILLRTRRYQSTVVANDKGVEGIITESALSAEPIATKDGSRSSPKTARRVKRRHVSVPHSNEARLPPGIAAENSTHACNSTASTENGTDPCFADADDRHDEDVEELVNYFLGPTGTSASSSSGGTSAPPRTDNTEKNGDNMYSEDNRRAHVICPNGYGKTMLALKTLTGLIERGDDPNAHQQDFSVLVATGSDRIPIKTAIYVTLHLHLVDQVLDACDKFGVLSNIPHRRMIISSSTGRSEGCTTDPELIADFLSSSIQDSDLSLMVSTYHSLHKIAEALTILKARGDTSTSVPSIGFAIFDEAHRMEGCSAMLGFGLDDDNMAIDRRLFLTATPNNYTETPRVLEVLGSKVDHDGALQLIPRRIPPSSSCTDDDDDAADGSTGEVRAKARS